MHYLRSFAPWIAYGVGAGLADWRLGAVAGLVVATCLWASARRTGGADLLATVTTGFFAVLATIAIVAPDAPIRPYTAALSLGTLGLAASASLLVGKPFTMAIARRETPQELWETELFWRVNVVITAVWAASFLLTATVCAAMVAGEPSATARWATVQAIGFALPVLFTRAYRARIAARFAPAPSPASSPA